MSFDTELPRPGALIGGRYRIESLLGQGGMGAVFAAVNEATGRAVALKWMLPSMARSRDAITRFMSEARATAKIEHPNVIQIFDVGEDNGAPFLVMERLRGSSLSARLQQGRLPPQEALAILIPACKGVSEAHAEGVIHRDLKPDNIFLTRGKDGEMRPPKVLDFGISKLYDTDEGAPSLTQTGIAMGTPTYMSPEQLNAPKHADGRFDVYAMGVVAYECLTGRPPYEADGLFALVQQIAAGNPTPIRSVAPEVPPELEAAVMRAMHVRADYRYPTMRDFIMELERIQPMLGSFDPRMAPPPSQPMMAAHMSNPITGPMGGMPNTGPSPTNNPWVQSAPGYPTPAPMMSQPMVPTPMGYPPGSMPMTNAAMHMAAPPQASSGGGSGLALIAVVGVIGVLGLGIIGIGIGYVVLRDSSSSGGGGGGGTTGGGGGGVGGFEIPVVEDNPRRPQIELTFSGDCRPRFDARVMVIGAQDSISVTSSTPGGITGSLTVSFNGITGTTNISTRQRMDQQTAINVMVGQTFWTNMALDSGAVIMNQIPDPISGSVTVAGYDSNLATMDVTFNNVTLQDMRNGGLCTLNGRIRTSGTTYGM